VYAALMDGFPDTTMLCDGLTCDDGVGRYDDDNEDVENLLLGYLESLAELSTMTVGTAESRAAGLLVVDSTWKCGPGRWCVDVDVEVGEDP
jgi:hypothetical protein